MTHTTAWLEVFDRKGQDTMEGGGAALMDSLAMSALHRSKLCGCADLAPMRATLDLVTVALLDLFSLGNVWYLLGVRDTGAPRHTGLGH
jgi:hypothetical protein